MEASILTSTKKILGLAEGYTVFDSDVVTFINTTFSVLDQLGVGPSGGFMITDEEPVWEELAIPANQLNLVKTFVFLNVKLLFDPPATSFHLSAAKAQLDEYAWRLNVFREDALPRPAPVTTDEDV